MLGLLTLQTEAYHCGIEQKVTQIMIQTNKLILYYKISQKTMYWKIINCRGN